MSDKHKILFFEESPQDVNLLEYSLRKAGVLFESRRVESLQDFEKTLENFDPEVVISDYQLSSGDGVQVLSSLRKTKAFLPFIFVSDSVGEERAIEALRLGATDFILKDHLYRLASSVQRAIQEMQEHRLREEAQEQLARRNAKLMEYQKVLLKLTKISPDSIENVWKQLTEISSRTLQVERVSIWYYDELKTSISCQDLFELSENKHSRGTVLKIEDYPVYFKNLHESRLLAVTEAQSNGITSEFAENYLKPLGIVSMMDVPIRIDGEVKGIMCHEHCGSLREWAVEEQNFASSVADIFSINWEALRRQKLEQQFKHLQIVQKM